MSTTGNRGLDALPDAIAGPLLTVDEVADMLQMSTAWVRQHSNGMRKPAIPCVKMGKSIRFRRERVMEFISSMERCA